jgi:hypothetical protein
VNGRVLRWIAYAVAALAIGLTAAGFVCFVAITLHDGQFAIGANGTGGFVLGFTFPIVGAIVASRRPQNPIGWIYLAIGLSQGLNVFAWAYADYGLVTVPGSLPIADFMSWVAGWTWEPGFVLFATIALLIFPDGHHLSPRWRLVSSGAIVCMILMMVPIAVASWPMRGIALVTMVPGAISGGPMDLAIGIQDVAFAFVGAAAVASLVSLVLRWRRARGIERAQLKWLAFAVMIEIPVLFFFAVDVFKLGPQVGAIATILATPLIPIAIGIAILRYRLYDIDRIISRTVSYGAVTGILALVFVGTILVAQTVLASFFRGSSVAVAASTLLVAAIFQPLRRRVQSVVDRRFNRSRYDAERTAAAFGARLRDEVDLANLKADVREVVAATVAPVTVGLWIRQADARS